MIILFYILALYSCLNISATAAHECKIDEVDILLFDEVICQQPILLGSLEAIKVKVVTPGLKLLTQGTDITEIEINKGNLQPVSRHKLTGYFKLGDDAKDTTIVINIKFAVISIIDENNGKLLNALFPLLKDKPIENAKLEEGVSADDNLHAFPLISVFYPTNNKGAYKYNFNIISDNKVFGQSINVTYKGGEGITYKTKTINILDKVPDTKNAVNPIYIRLFPVYISTSSGSYHTQPPAITFMSPIRLKTGTDSLKVDGNVKVSDTLKVDYLNFNIRHFLFNLQGDYFEVFVTSDYILSEHDVSLEQLKDPTKPDETTPIKASRFATYSNLANDRVACLTDAKILETADQKLYKIIAADVGFTTHVKSMKRLFYECFGGNDLYKQTGDQNYEKITIQNGGFYYYRFQIKGFDDNSKLKVRFTTNPKQQNGNLLTNMKLTSNEWKIEDNAELVKKENFNLGVNTNFLLQGTIANYNETIPDTVKVHFQSDSIHIQFTKRIIENLNTIQLTYKFEYYTNSINNIINLPDGNKNDTIPRSIFSQLPEESNNFEMVLNFNILEMILDKNVEIDSIKIPKKVKIINLKFNFKEDEIKHYYLIEVVEVDDEEKETRKIMSLNKSVIRNHTIVLFESPTQFILHSITYKTKKEKTIENETKTEIIYGDAFAISKMKLNENRSLFLSTVGKTLENLECDYLDLCIQTDTDKCPLKYTKNKLTIQKESISEDTDGLLFPGNTEFETDIKLKDDSQSKILTDGIALEIKAPEPKNSEKKGVTDKLVALLRNLTNMKLLNLKNTNADLGDHPLFQTKFTIGKGSLQETEDIGGGLEKNMLRDSAGEIIPNGFKQLASYKTEKQYLQWDFGPTDKFLVKRQKSLFYNCRIFNQKGSTGKTEFLSYTPIKSLKNDLKEFVPFCFETDLNKQFNKEIKDFTDDKFNYKLGIKQINSENNAIITIVPSIVTMSDENMNKEKDATDITPLQQVINVVKVTGVPTIIADNRIFLDNAGKKETDKDTIKVPYILVISSTELKNGFPKYIPNSTTNPNFAVTAKVNLFDDSLRATIIATEKAQDQTKFQTTEMTPDTVGKNYKSLQLKDLLIKNLGQDISVVEFGASLLTEPNFDFKISFKPFIQIKLLETKINFKNELKMIGIVETETKEKAKIDAYRAKLLNYIKAYTVEVNGKQFEFNIYLKTLETKTERGKFEYDLEVKMFSGTKPALSNIIETDPKLEIKLTPTNKIVWDKTDVEISTILWEGTVDAIKIPVSIGNIVIIIVFVLLLLMVFGITGLTIYLAYTKVIKMEKKRAKIRELEDTDYFFD
eukprot:GAHX01001499.1.p1 GENE.GAHX01001499.1~~GAHX01001499.1.p1  ORF type:complete len:1313 (-),score=279.82 GAHX01001499.1:371-4309(-)